MGSQIHAKSTPKPSKRVFLNIFFRIAFGHLWGPIFIGSGVRKLNKNRSKIDVQSDLAENAKSLKNLRFIRFLRIRGVGNRVKIVFEPTSEKDAQPHPKNVTKNGQLSPETIQVEGQVGPKIAARGYPRASSQKDRKRYKTRRRPSTREMHRMGGGPCN